MQRSQLTNFDQRLGLDDILVAQKYEAAQDFAILAGDFFHDIVAGQIAASLEYGLAIAHLGAEWQVGNLLKTIMIFSIK